MKHTTITIAAEDVTRTVTTAETHDGEVVEASAAHARDAAAGGAWSGTEEEEEEQWEKKSR